MWIAVVMAGAGCYLLKLAGLSVPHSILEHPLVQRVGDLIPVALLSALVAVQVFVTGQAWAFDARAAGLLTAVLLLVWRRSFLTVVIASAAVAALVRAVG